MNATEENDLRGPALSRIDHVEGSPTWWIRGAQIRNKSDGQKARAAYSPDGSPVACLERGIAGVFKFATHFAEWEPDDVSVDLTPMEKARISYSADRALLTSLGTPGVPEWTGLIEQNRIAWMAAAMENVPLHGDHSTIRNALRFAIWKVLRAA